MTNWSQVGRKSRRKGKQFEREIAVLLREITGYDWQTVRNSGRTDIKGDVYCLEPNMQTIHIECKHGDHFNILHLIRPTNVVKCQFKKTEEEVKDSKSKLSIFFAKNQAGTWAALASDNKECNKFIYDWTSRCSTYLRITDKVWFLVEYGKCEESTFLSLLGCLLNIIKEDNGEKR